MKKAFKSESKRLLDLMINSIYTNKDIFLRELISNASDALDKLYYQSLTDKNIKVSKDALAIKLSFDPKERTLTIEDNGCGMNKEELENNLGTIAKSGSLAFKEMLEQKDNIDIIGQFGVGFYSAFMVSDKITVTSKSFASDKAYIWTSSGADGYDIEESTKDENGTIITLHLKEDTDGEKYSDYLTEDKIKLLVKKYSDYIRYPIQMFITKDNQQELETLNSMIPLWKKDKKDIHPEDYDNFYMDKFLDYEKPLKVIPTSVEGACSYKGLLFIPNHAPYDFYTKEYEKGLSLYANGVLIMDKCPDLLPDYFSFVKGVIDSEDLSLNISREMLQKNKNLKLMAKNIESKIKNELVDMLNNDRENYKKFFKVFGMQIKFGVYNNYGLDKDKLQDLLMFYSSSKNDYITLKEYIESMKPNQENIYYACGETIDKIDHMPQTEQIKEKDYEILYLTDYVDEFTLNTLMSYEDKKFLNISNENVDLEDEQSKEKLREMNENNKDLLVKMKDLLQISDVKFTNRLKTHPVCLTSKGPISIEMEKVINAMPSDDKIKAEAIMEINQNHPIAKKLQELYKDNSEEFSKYTKILYSEARLIEGLPIDNPTEISNLICDLLAK